MTINIYGNVTANTKYGITPISSTSIQFKAKNTTTPAVGTEHLCWDYLLRWLKNVMISYQCDFCVIYKLSILFPLFSQE